MISHDHDEPHAVTPHDHSHSGDHEDQHKDTHSEEDGEHHHHISCDGNVAMVSADSNRHALFDRTPLRLALLKREEAARARLSIAQADRLGNMEAGLLLGNDIDHDNLSVGIGFTMDLPIWNKNEAAIAGAQASVDAARSELRQFEPARVSAVVKLRYLQS